MVIVSWSYHTHIRQSHAQHNPSQRHGRHARAHPHWVDQTTPAYLSVSVQDEEYEVAARGRPPC